MRIKPCFANDVNIVFLNFWVRIAVLKNKRGIARIEGNKKDPSGRWLCVGRGGVRRTGTALHQQEKGGALLL